MAAHETLPSTDAGDFAPPPMIAAPTEAGPVPAAASTDAPVEEVMYAGPGGGTPEAAKEAFGHYVDDEAGNDAAIAKLKKLDPNNPGAIVVDAREALRAVPPAERAAIIATLPPAQQALAWSAMGLVAGDDVRADQAAAKLDALSLSDDLDAKEIREQLRSIPVEMRNRALADLPEETRQRIADQQVQDSKAVEANQRTADKLHQLDFTKKGSYEAAIAALANVPATERAAVIESLPAGKRECASAATGILIQQETNAAFGVSLLQKASAAGVPDDKAIETSLGMMTPTVSAKALAELPEATRAAVEAKLVEGKRRAAEGAKLLTAAGGDKEAVHRALKDLPAWEKENVLRSLSPDAKTAADGGLAEIAKCDAAKQSLEALSASDEKRYSTMAVDKALEGVPPERYAEVKGELSPAAQAEVTKTEVTHKQQLEEKLEALEDDKFAQGAFPGKSAKEELEQYVADMPPAMRNSVITSMPEGEARDQATSALQEVHRREENARKYDALMAAKVDAGATEFAELVKSKPKTEADEDPGKAEDAKKQYDQKLQEALAKIPYGQRDAALAAMSPDARAEATTAIAKKKEEMRRKASQLTNAINAGMLENGTDTTTILQTLATLTPDERKELEAEYGTLNLDKDGNPRDLEADLMREFKDQKNAIGMTTRSYKLDRELVSAVFSGDTVEQKAIALQLGARGSSLTDCTDEVLIMKTLESCKSAEEREQVFATFRERQQKAGSDITDVSMMLRDEMVTGDVDEDDYDYKRAMALTTGEFDKAKAVEIEEHMDPGFLGDVSIRDAAALGALVPGGGLISTGIAAADATGVIDADRKVAEPQVEKVAEVYAGASSQAQREKISGEFAESKGKTVTDIAKERCPDKHDVKLVEFAEKNDKDGVAAARWMKNASSMNADEQGMMTQIGGPRHKEVIERIDSEFGEGTFNSKSKAVMNEEELAANTEIAENGTVKPITGLLAATPQVSFSWSLEDLQKHLKDPKDPKKLLSKEKMAELKDQLCKEKGIKPEEFDEMIDHKLGGKDAFTFRQMLKGEPANRQERMERMREEQNFNREGAANWLGKQVTDQVSFTGEAQDAQMKRLEEINSNITRLEEKQAAGTLSADEEAELAKANSELDERSDCFGTNVKNYQASRDTISNDITTIAAATAGAVATLMTGGAAGPLVGALIAGLTTMASKTALLGDTYNDHDMTKDKLQTGVSMLAAGASSAAGPLMEAISSKLGGAAGALLKGPAGEVLKDLVAAGAKGTMSGGIGGFISSAGGVLLDEKTLQGKGDIGDMVTKTVSGTVSSAAGGGATAVIGKGLDHAGLQSADPTKTFSSGGHAANKAISTVGGDAVAFGVDPANLKGPDALGKFLQKEAMSLPGAVISAHGEYDAASKRQANATALGIPHADIGKPENKARIDSFEAHKKTGFMEQLPLTPEERTFKAQQDAELQKLTKPADDPFPLDFEADDFDPRRQGDEPLAAPPPKGPLPKARPQVGEPTRTGSLPDVEPDLPDHRSPLEQVAADMGCGPEMAWKAAALSTKDSIPLPEAIERIRQARNLTPETDPDAPQVDAPPPIPALPWDLGMPALDEKGKRAVTSTDGTVTAKVIRDNLALRFPDDMPLDRRHEVARDALNKLGVDADDADIAAHIGGDGQILIPQQRRVVSGADADATARELYMDPASVEGRSKDTRESLKAKCTKLTLDWQGRLAESGVYAPMMNAKALPDGRGGHRFIVVDGVIIDPSFGQFLNGKGSDREPIDFEPFIGNYDAMEIRVQKAIADGHMVGYKDAAEALAANWGLHRPGADKSAPLRFDDSVVPTVFDNAIHVKTPKDARRIMDQQRALGQQPGDGIPPHLIALVEAQEAREAAERRDDDRIDVDALLAR